MLFFFFSAKFKTEYFTVLKFNFHGYFLLKKVKLTEISIFKYRISKIE